MDHDPQLVLAIVAPYDELDAHGICGCLDQVGAFPIFGTRWTATTKHTKMGAVGLVGKYLSWEKRQTSTFDGQPTQAIERAYRRYMRSCRDVYRMVPSLL